VNISFFFPARILSEPPLDELALLFTGSRVSPTQKLETTEETEVVEKTHEGKAPASALDSRKGSDAQEDQSATICPPNAPLLVDSLNASPISSSLVPKLNPTSTTYIHPNLLLPLPSYPPHPLFKVEQLGVDRRLLVNRKRQLKMYRVWMQGKFRKIT
jgi:tRNAThr (cytosine32-N3)-methyltransferase